MITANLMISINMNDLYKYKHRIIFRCPPLRFFPPSVMVQSSPAPEVRKRWARSGETASIASHALVGEAVPVASWL